MSISFPGESAEYRAARDRLLAQEIELRRATEAVAAARRSLPPGGAVPENYVFRGRGADGAPADVRLSDLFAAGMDSLVIYSFAIRGTCALAPRAGRRRSCRCTKGRARRASRCSTSSREPPTTQGS
jgi:predicted dithiol-disulfide oxidoreductase (DUF899 family)